MTYRYMLAVVMALGLGNAAIAETLNGVWKNPASGQKANSSIEIKSETVIYYCIQGAEKTCWDMQVDETLASGALEVRQDDSYMDGNGKEIVFEHIWTFTPKNAGYAGRYEVQVPGQERAFRASASFK